MGIAKERGGTRCHCCRQCYLFNESLVLCAFISVRSDIVFEVFFKRSHNIHIRKKILFLILFQLYFFLIKI